MNKLLIHNQNSPLTDEAIFSGDEQFFFDIDLDTSDIDFAISTQLENGVLRAKILKSQVIYLKVSLSQNYLEYLGIRLACHIRMTKSLNEHCNIPIIFIAEESCQFIGITSSIPEILFTEGIYLMNDNRNDLARFSKLCEEGVIRPLRTTQSFIDKINIPPPANYLSHHSIANEWSIMRWAQLLGVNDQSSLLGLKNNIRHLLFYKFLIIKFPVEVNPDNSIYKIDGLGKILFIDDEWEKGWNTVLGKIFLGNPNLEFHVLKNNFKDQDQASVVDFCKKEVETMSPDLVILDLRLIDKDFDEDRAPNQLTGFKVLKTIKQINPGIQVLIFTASNKVWNFLELQNEGANAFILKESPELSLNRVGTKEIIKKFCETIRERLEYRFQKVLYSKCIMIFRCIEKEHVEGNDEYNCFISDIKKQLEVILSSIALININKKVTIDIVFLSCYNFLELFKKYYLIFENDYRYYLGIELVEMNRYEVNGKKVKNCGAFISNSRHDTPSWFATQSALFIDYFKSSSPPNFAEVYRLKQISEERNRYIHSNKGHFEISEVELIIDAMANACSHIKD